MAFLKERLNKIEMPTTIEFRDSLPKTLVGKLSKKELVEEEAARRAADKPRGQAE
jgi:long-chain acyl-CoA synthetase